MLRLFTTLNGYDICHNEEEIIEASGYDPDRDLENPCGSVFCSHGAGYNVAWNEVPEHMHLESVLAKEIEEEEFDELTQRRAYIEEESIDTEEIDRILEQTFYANQHNKSKWKKKKTARLVQDYHTSAEKSSVKRDMSKKYLLVDGYNIIYAWDDLKELLDTNVDAARGKLLDEMSNYQGMKGMELIVVFDAYRVKGHETEITDYMNIHVVYTKEAETADQYIEKFAHTHGRKYDVTVATSDGLEQIIIRGQGCRLLSARELKRDYEEAKAQIRTEYLENQKNEKTYMMDDNPEMDSWVMKETTISELVEDEKQKLLYVFDYMTERCFFIELSEIITGKEMTGAKCTKKSGDAPKQTVDFEEMAAAGGSLDLDENFYGDQDFDMEDFDQEGFDIGGDAGGSFEEEKF